MSAEVAGELTMVVGETITSERFKEHPEPQDTKFANCVIDCEEVISGTNCLFHNCRILRVSAIDIGRHTFTNCDFSDAVISHYPAGGFIHRFTGNWFRQGHPPRASSGEIEFLEEFFAVVD